MPKFSERLAGAARALLGESVYTGTVPTTGVEITAPRVEKARKRLGGQIQPLRTPQPRWHLTDLQAAEYEVAAGQFSRIGMLWESMQRDGLIKGLSDVSTAGLVALPRRYRGDPTLIELLRAEADSVSIFDEMFPPAELAMLAADGNALGVGVAEMVPVEGREHPRMVRLDPQFLVYRWNEDRWYYRSTVGMLVITPGDGRWILHLPGGKLNPGAFAAWRALGRAFIVKEHALNYRANYSAKLANPARVAQAPQAATESQRQSLLQKVMAWGVNTVFALPVGYEIKLLESNGRGWEVFGAEITDANFEIMITLAGQVVTVTGGTGFANAGIHATIRADLIKRTADALADTINSQGIRPWVLVVSPGDVAKSPRVSWDIAPPTDRKAEAESLTAIALAIDSLRRTLAACDMALDVTEIVNRHGITVLATSLPADKAVIALGVDAVAASVTVDEAREEQGLDPIGDERGDMTLQEVKDAAKQTQADAAADTADAVADAPPAPKAFP